MSVKLILKIYNPLPSNGEPENRLICSGPGGVNLENPEYNAGRKDETFGNGIV